VNTNVIGGCLPSLTFAFGGCGFVAPHTRQRFTELGCSLMAFITPTLLRFRQAQTQCVLRLGIAEPVAPRNKCRAVLVGNSGVWLAAFMRELGRSAMAPRLSR
jgi:hypothetical protein